MFASLADRGKSTHEFDGISVKTYVTFQFQKCEGITRPNWPRALKAAMETRDLITLENKNIYFDDFDSSLVDSINRFS